MAKAFQNSAAARIQAFNSGRDPELLAMKYAAMRQDAFVFLRGTCHLFYEDLAPPDLHPSPLIWCCGDLHLQNFGTYKGENRLVYFDLNDFDEACLAPASWELARFLTSAIVGGKTLGMDRRATKSAAQAFLEGYTAALKSGKALWLERATADGIIRALLARLKRRKRKKFLNGRTAAAKGRRRLLIDGQKTLPLEKGQLAMLRRFMAEFAARQPDPDFFELRDAARRIAGTGSLGVERYVLLVEGRGSPDANFLLDLKHQPGSCAVAARGLPQPEWKSQGQRVAVTQHDVQAMSPALLQAVELRGQPFVIHELMPTNDRLDMSNWRADAAGFEHAIRIMGEIVAWGNLRSGSRRGASTAEELIAFGNETNWLRPIVEYATDRARRTEKQWREFVEWSIGTQA